ncbi:hypothetical protein Thexy_2246 [Thermoanaerobacterium xylanolyticum LX-11]|uniref:Uncharacterized protein n=1 Tax=Thermoanaerobacterium xylanolyticum (strain ATCC 49914 / DSM 7097 / LX-11) TaxID=858215 RepID=F6BLB5_THEXL|nr:hypothetical protein Thexy_2246 [Thermoanaerobacterium xylanolyticum LX-11]
MLFKYFISRYYQNSGDLFITYISFIIAGMYVGENIREWGKYYHKKLLNSFFAVIVFGYLFIDISLKVFADKQIDSNLYNIYYYAFTLVALLFFFRFIDENIKLPCFKRLIVKYRQAFIWHISVPSALFRCAKSLFKYRQSISIRYLHNNDICYNLCSVIYFCNVY